MNSMGISRIAIVLLFAFAIAIGPAFVMAESTTNVPIIKSFSGPDTITRASTGPYHFALQVYGGSPPYSYKWTKGTNAVVREGPEYASVDLQATDMGYNGGGVWLWVEVTDSKGNKAVWQRPDGNGGNNQFSYGFKWPDTTNTAILTTEPAAYPYKMPSWANADQPETPVAQGTGTPGPAGSSDSSGPDIPLIPLAAVAGAVIVGAGVYIGSKMLGGKGEPDGEPPGTTTIDNHDGSITKRLPDGTVVTGYTDGTENWQLTNGDTYVKYPDGTEKLFHPDGSSEISHPDGSWREAGANGAWIDHDKNDNVTGFRKSDGGEAKVNADGTWTATLPDGSHAETDKDGNITTATINLKDGAVSKISGDGSLIITDKNGKVESKVDAEGNFHTTLDDGRKVDVGQDGGMKISAPNGDAVTVDQNGNGTFSGKDGLKGTVSADGTTSIQTPDGASATLKPDGSLNMKAPDGSSQSFTAGELAGGK
jgi:hypothetical protein